VVLPGGRRIEVHPDFDTSTFERLVSLLEQGLPEGHAATQIIFEQGDLLG
jgi:hypothetical protein